MRRSFVGTLFDDHVARATAGIATERNLLPVVENEILHRDILREMQEAGLLKSLTFFGGTILRLCHASNRLSEDLDFKGGREFTAALMDRLPRVLEEGLSRKYSLDVSVEEPKPKEGNTDTWTIRVITRPQTKTEKQHKINIDIDICSLVNYEREPRLLSNEYAVDLGTTGLIVQVQSKKETYTDKLIAFALRNRIKPRDLWDLTWLKQTQSDTTPVHLAEKIVEHKHTPESFFAAFEGHLDLVRTDPGTRDEYLKEMSRFLPAKLMVRVQTPEFWTYTGNLLDEELGNCRRVLPGFSSPVWSL
jgi:predicted nucleotidyltransferase component of viral defense system